MASKDSQVVVLRSPEIIENEAAAWLARLDAGDLSANDRRALQAWLAKSPEHAREIKRLAEIWHEMDLLLNEIPGISAPQGRPEMRPALALFVHAKKLAYVSTLFLAVMIGYFFWPQPEPGDNQASLYTTEIGEHRRVQFSDGSSAHMNTNSMIITEFSDAARIVRLLRGEALFEVRHDPGRPFIVYVGNRMVKAVGTRFVVRLDSENIIVTVTEGQVQLSKRHSERDLASSHQEQEVAVTLVSKGEQVVVMENSASPAPVTIQNDELQRRLSWMDGQLVFENERLEHVIKEVSRNVPVRIIVEDPTLLDIRISGRFKMGDTEALLEALEVSFEMRAHKIGDEVHFSPN